MRALSWLLLVAGICLLVVVGGWYHVASLGLAIEAENEVEGLSCRPAEKCDVRLRLHNRSSAPIRVLGLADC
jgi:hypothetical protein